MKRWGRFFHNLRFKQKLLLSYSVVALIPLISWSLYSYQQTNASLRVQTGIRFQEIIGNARDNLQSRVRKIENAFALIARDPSIGQIINNQYQSSYRKYYDVTQKFDPMANTLLGLNPEVESIDIYTTGSIKSARMNFLDLEEALRTKERLRQLNNTDMTWFLDGGTLTVAQKVYSIDDPRKYAILALKVKYDAFFSEAVPDNLDNYGILVEDASGQILFREDGMHNRPDLAQLSLEEIRALCRKTEDMLLESQSIAPPGWTIHMYMDINAILVSPKSAVYSTAIIIGVSLLLILVVIVLFSKTFIKRIGALNTSLASVVSSRFTVDISSDYRDEIGEITNSVGAMVQETRELIHEVYESRLLLREAEIKALQSQINPHFLYNTLSAINWQAIKSGDMGISNIITTLSTFYRTILNKNNNVTTVRAELENTTAYLTIQRNIHSNSFDYSFDVDEAVLDYNMPNIILQPIVENAIEHGIDCKNDGERGTITIRVRASGNDIVFEVIDNGMGMSEENIRDVLVNSKKGYGVKNVNERLQLFFDKDYGLTLQRVQPHGTRATIRIPKYIHV